MIKLTDILFEYVTKSDMRSIENYADKLFAAAGIDVDFTRHFRQRVNDERNIKPITNMPFVFALDKSGELDLIAKTIMRKKNFQTTNKILDI